MNRQLSPSGRAFLEAREGVVLHWYRDVAGVLTCGVGHAWVPGESVFEPHEGDPITQAQCDAFLAHDVAKCEEAINRLVTVPLTQCQFDACVSLSFNIGTAGFASSTVLRVINGSTEKTLEDAWCMWRKIWSNGREVDDPGLLARRKLEVALYMTPDQATPDVA